MIRTRPMATPEAVQLHIANRLRMQRLANGLTQAQLAKRIGVTQKQILKYEHCADHIRAERLYHLAIALDCSIGYFFNEMPVGDVPPSKMIPANALKIDRIEMLRNFELMSKNSKQCVRTLIRGLARNKPPTGGI